MNPAPPQRPHLLAAAIALALLGAAVLAGLIFSNRFEPLYVHELSPDLSEAKLQGVALQRHAFAQPDLLVLYGSSELVQEVPNHATQFFQDYPTGFRVFPVGKEGTTSLAILQKVAAVGPGIRGKRAALSISPGWFFTEVFDPKYYEGNFSRLQAGEVAFSTQLSLGLKRDIADRMLDFPKTLEGEWLLGFALERLAADGPLDRLLYGAIWPLGCLQNAIGRAQDHFESVMHIMAEDAKLNQPERRGLRALNWTDLRKRAALHTEKVAPAKRSEVVKRRAKRLRDRAPNPERPFIDAVAKAREWNDLELLLRTFRELGARPLLLAMPVEDIRLEVYGVSATGRAKYLDRLAEIARHYDATLFDFREHQADPSFLVDFLDHLSPAGWLYYNKALDDFFHRPE